MSDQTTTIETPATTAAPAPAGGVPAPTVTTPVVTPPAERTFTQAELNQIVADRLQRDRQSRGNEPPKAAEQRAPAPAATEAQRLDRLEAENVLFRAASRQGVTLSDEQEADLLDLYRTQRPEQPGTWFERKVAAFNLKPAAPPPPTIPTVNPGAAAPPPVPPAVSTTAPGAPTVPVPGVLVDVSRFTPAQVAAMSPQALVQAVSGAIASGAGASGLPTPPHLRLRKT